MIKGRKSFKSTCFRRIIVRTVPKLRACFKRMQKTATLKDSHVERAVADSRTSQPHSTTKFNTSNWYKVHHSHRSNTRHNPESVCMMRSRRRPCFKIIITIDQTQITKAASSNRTKSNFFTRQCQLNRTVMRKMVELCSFLISPLTWIMQLMVTMWTYWHRLKSVSNQCPSKIPSLCQLLANLSIHLLKAHQGQFQINRANFS